MAFNQRYKNIRGDCNKISLSDKGTFYTALKSCRLIKIDNSYFLRATKKCPASKT